MPRTDRLQAEAEARNALLDELIHDGRFSTYAEALEEEKQLFSLKSVHVIEAVSKLERLPGLVHEFTPEQAARARNGRVTSVTKAVSPDSHVTVECLLFPDDDKIGREYVISTRKPEQDRWEEVVLLVPPRNDPKAYSAAGVMEHWNQRPDGTVEVVGVRWLSNGDLQHVMSQVERENPESFRRVDIHYD